MKKYLIPSFISLFLASASAQSINQVHFGYLKWNKNGTTVRLEMNLAPSFSEKNPGELYELFIKMFLEKDLSKPVSEVYNWANMKNRCNPRTKSKETKLTESQFKSLATEKIGDIYTLVCADGIWKAKVSGGTIAIDEQFDDLFRVYLDMEIEGFQPPVQATGTFKSGIISFAGDVGTVGVKGYKQAVLDRNQQLEVEKIFKSKIKKGFDKYYFVYFRKGQDLIMVAENVIGYGSKEKYAGKEEYQEIAKYLPAIYLRRSGSVIDVLPAKVALDNEIDTPSSFKALYGFEIAGKEYLCIEEVGQACCAGGPFSQYHIFQLDSKTKAFKEIGESQAYPLCIELFI